MHHKGIACTECNCITVKFLNSSRSWINYFHARRETYDNVNKLHVALWSIQIMQLLADCCQHWKWKLQAYPTFCYCPVAAFNYIRACQTGGPRARNVPQRVRKWAARDFSILMVQVDSQINSPNVREKVYNHKHLMRSGSYFIRIRSLAEQNQLLSDTCRHFLDSRLGNTVFFLTIFRQKCIPLRKNAENRYSKIKKPGFVPTYWLSALLREKLLT